MEEIKPCPFVNYNCMCQFCTEPCNNGLNCLECEDSGKAEHSVYMCTGFTGDLDAYLENWKNQKLKQEGKQ